MLHLLSTVYFVTLLLLCVALLGALLRNEAGRIAEVLGLVARAAVPALPPRRRAPRGTARVMRRQANVRRAAA